MSEANLRRLSELALIAIASIWGLTFVMVKDAIEELPVWSALIVTSLIASALGFFVQSFAQQHAPVGFPVAPTGVVVAVPFARRVRSALTRRALVNGGAPGGTRTPYPLVRSLVEAQFHATARNR